MAEAKKATSKPAAPKAQGPADQGQSHHTAGYRVLKADEKPDRTTVAAVELLHGRDE